jgi:hypothetical protein
MNSIDSIAIIGQTGARNRHLFSLTRGNIYKSWESVPMTVCVFRVETWTFRGTSSGLVKLSQNCARSRKLYGARPPIPVDRRYDWASRSQEWSLIRDQATTRTISRPLKAILCKRSRWEHRQLAGLPVVWFALLLTRPLNHRPNLLR